MRIGIISDIHGNKTALLHAANQMADQNLDQIWCLGDVLDGWTDEDAEFCLVWVRANCDVVLRGNHDQELLSKHPVLKEHPVESLKGAVGLWHGSPRWNMYEYVYTLQIARDNLQYLRKNHPAVKLGLVGHTHVPSFFNTLGEHLHLPNSHVLDLTRQNLLIACPGSIGQSHDDGMCEWSVLELDGDIPKTLSWHKSRYRKAKPPTSFVIKADKASSAVADNSYR